MPLLFNILISLIFDFQYYFYVVMFLASLPLLVLEKVIGGFAKLLKLLIIHPIIFTKSEDVQKVGFIVIGCHLFHLLLLKKTSTCASSAPTASAHVIPVG